MTARPAGPVPISARGPSAFKMQTFGSFALATRVHEPNGGLGEALASAEGARREGSAGTTSQGHLMRSTVDCPAAYARRRAGDTMAVAVDP